MQDNISPEERLLRFVKEGAKKSPKNEKSGDLGSRPDRTKLLFFLKPSNRTLSATLLILGLYLLADFLIVSPGRIEERILTLEAEGGKKSEAAPTDVTKKQIVPVSYYLESTKLRNLFTAEAARVTPAASATFMEMVSKLKLQGIISGPNPQAVIKDIKTNQVYFLSPGEHIGGIKLQEILSGKVRLYYRGQEVELAL